ncbi:type III glutamate--ammonia ligase [Nesterenkonia lutea]
MASPSLKELTEQHKTRFILALFVDLNGKPCAKLVPVEAVDQLIEEGVGFAGYAAGAMGQEPKDPDIMAMPDASSFTPVPFIREGLAIVHCDPHVEGRPWGYAPRVILKDMIAKAAEKGYEPQLGAEVEYFLLKKDAEGRLVTADDGDNHAQPCYDARGVTRMFGHLSEISEAMNALGWGNYANDHEDGNGQFEQNFHYDEALITADRVVTLRYLITMIAEKRGMIATFMPKPFADRTGTGLHFHISLTSQGKPIFPGGSAPEVPDAHGLGLSEDAYHFVGGLLEHANALQALLAPTVNSYKRTGAVATTSGASWAPRTATYGGNDRTHYIRVPDAHRVELRGGDGAANPYLAASALIGAGLDGIEKKRDPGTPGDGREHEPCLPLTLVDAVEALEADQTILNVLNTVDPGVGRYYNNLKREEFHQYHAQVTEWEIQRYLTAV